MTPVLATSLAACLVAAPTEGPMAHWDTQLEEMTYWTVHISAINAINALNLNHTQAEELRRLARQVEKAGARVPLARGAMHPDLAAARKTYVKLKATLLRQEEVGAKAEQEVARARTVHAKVVADSLTAVGRDAGRCTGCHVAPTGYPTKSPPREVGPRGEFIRAMLARQIKDPKVLAHMDGLYGWDGLAEVIRLSADVDRVLTDGQKEIIHKFACCLIPPSELSDPVRAGEVEVSDRVLKLLRDSRSCPAKLWPYAKRIVLDRIAQGERIKHPGADQARLEATRTRVASMLDRARAMSDTEFEVRKEALCVELKPADAPPPANRVEACFRAAYFLLLPGSDGIYTEVLRRLGGQRTASR